MHIKNLSGRNTGRQHRLYVAVPVFTLCVALSFGQGMLRGSALEEGPQPVVTAGEGVTRPEGADLRLEHGTVMIAAHGMARVLAGGASVTVWNGAADVTYNQGILDVAALTSPALVRGGEQIWLIPAGTQQRLPADSPLFGDDPALWLEKRRTAPLPPHYLQERLPLAETLLRGAGYRRIRDDARFLPPLAGQILRLDASRTRAEEEALHATVHALYHALLAGNTDAAHAALLDPAAERALRTDIARPLLPGMVALAAETGLDALLLPFLMQDPDALLLTLAHPATRDGVWVQAFELPTDQTFAALLALPRGDRAEHAVQELAVQRWGDRWVALMDGTDLHMLLADLALPALEREISALESAGYPERSRRYASVAADAFASHAEVLSPSALRILERLQRLSQGMLPVTEAVTIPEPAAQTQASSAASSAAPDPQRAYELEAAVRQALTDAGCMFTSKTVIRAVTTDRVDVGGVVIGSAAGDRLLDFRYDAASGQVVDIVKDGQVLPYSLPLTQYLEWVKGVR